MHCPITVIIATPMALAGICWKLAMLPEEVIDYIIVHELAHLKKMNHSAGFWAEIEKVMPEYQECRCWLNKHGKEYEIF